MTTPIEGVHLTTSDGDKSERILSWIVLALYTAAAVTVGIGIGIGLYAGGATP